MNITVGIDPRYMRGKRGKLKRLEYWREGVESQGDELLLMRDNNFFDIGLTWGVNSQCRMVSQCSRHVVMEYAFLGDRARKEYYIGYSALNGLGQPLLPAEVGGGERWYHKLKPHKEGVKNILILGQMPKDANLAAFSSKNRVKGYMKWLRGQIIHYHSLGYNVRYKLHPKHGLNSLGLPNTASFSDIQDAFSWGDAAVAFNSNSLVEAAIAGLYVIPSHVGSMAWNIRSREGHWRKLTLKDRQRWLDHVDSFQWSGEDITSGKVWKIIKESF